MAKTQATAGPRGVTLDVASNYYPFFGALMSGRHQAYGLDMRWHYVDPPNKLFRQVLKSPRYDVTELSLSSYTMMREQGWRDYKAFPIFTSRRFRHSALFVRAGSRLVSGEQLKGRRVGVPDFHMTAAVWIRGILQEDSASSPRTSAGSPAGWSASSCRPPSPTR